MVIVTATELWKCFVLRANQRGFVIDYIQGDTEQTIDNVYDLYLQFLGALSHPEKHSVGKLVDMFLDEFMDYIAQQFVDLTPQRDTDMEIESKGSVNNQPSK